MSRRSELADAIRVASETLCELNDLVDKHKLPLNVAALDAFIDGHLEVLGAWRLRAEKRDARIDDLRRALAQLLFEPGPLDDGRKVLIQNALAADEEAMER